MIYALLVFAFICLLIVVGTLLWVLNRVLSDLRRVTDYAANPNFEVMPQDPAAKKPVMAVEDDDQLPDGAIAFDDMSPAEREAALSGSPGFALPDNNSSAVGESGDEETREAI